MASPVPAKSEQLHNFSLPQLKWKKNHSTNLHRRRRVNESPPHHHRYPLCAVAPIGDSESEFVSDHREAVDDDVEKSEKDSKSKIYIRLRRSSKVSESVNDEIQNQNQDHLPKKDEDHGTEKGVVIEKSETEEFEEPKTWNLRPRKPLKKAMNVDSRGTMKIQENRTRFRTDVISNSNNNVEKKEKKKQKFSINLSREEIEHDFFILTGSKPSRKPKKRAKTIQKQLDNVFPGLWLSSVTPDCYKVPDPPIKG